MFKVIEKEQLKVPAHTDYLSDLRDFVTQIGKKYGFSDRHINAFKLAIDEAATNIIRHAYRDKEGLITIRAIIKKKSLTIALIDQGTYFDPQRVKDPDLRRYVEIGKKGGLGIFIMRKLMDDIDYRKTEEGNELRITKYREAPQKKKLVSAVSTIPLSLKAKYFFRTVSIISLFILAGYFYFYFKADDNILAEFVASGQAISTQIINRISSAPTEELKFIEDVVHPIDEEYKDRIYRLSIEDSTKEIVYSTILQEMLGKFSRPSEFQLIEPGIYKYALKDGTTVFEFERPIILKNTGTVYGKAHILLSTELAMKQISAIRINDLKLALFILGLSYIGVAVLIYIVMNPFRKLADWVKALGHGEIEDEMDIDASTEIGEIAQAFSEITQKFRESQKNLADQERLQKEMQVAQEIQQTLLPMEFPELEGYDIASYYEAAKEVGGDYFDFVEVDKDTLGIAVADVSGKGVPGSLVMTMIRTALRTEARGLKDAAEVLSRVNDFVSGDMKKGMFVTIFYLIIDSKKRRLSYASAGHNPMILYRASTKKTYYLNPKGFPIGIQLLQKDLFRNYIQSDTIQLAEDDILLVYTDGITEAMNSKRVLFGEERFLKILREYGHLPVNSFVEKLKNGIYSFTEGTPQYDDITLVAIKEKSSREKDELRRAKEAHQLINEGKSIREACETVGITTYAYYNKYKRIFEEEGIESFEIDEEVSVEAKHLSIEEKTKIYDIIANHPEYGAGRISDELNTEKYGYTQINESKIYEELVRSRLNTRQLREAYIAKSKKDRRRLKPPGTPLLTLDGRIVLEREIEKPAALDEKTHPPIETQKEKEEPSEAPVETSGQEIDISQISVKPPISDEKIEKDLEPEIEADALIDSSIEELLSKEDSNGMADEKTEPQMSEIISSENEKETKDMEEDSDLIAELLPETNLFNEENELEKNISVPSEGQDEKPEESLDEDISFEELFEEGIVLEEDKDLESEHMLSNENETDILSPEPSEKKGVEPPADDLERSQGEKSEMEKEEEINLDFLKDEDEEKELSVSDIKEEIDESLTVSSVEELLGEEYAKDSDQESEVVSDELMMGAEVESEFAELDQESESFSDLIQAIDEEISYFPEPSEDQNEASFPNTNEEKSIGDETKVNHEIEESNHELQEKEKLLIDGIKYYKNRDYENAIKEFKKVIEIYPDFKEAHNILGNAYFRNNMFQEAAITYEKVKQIDPEDITAYENMGVIYANNGQYKQAINEWKKVLELNPERTDIKKKIEKAFQMMK